MIEYTQVETDLCDNTGAKYQFAEVNTDGIIQGYRRADGDWDIPLELDKEVIADLALIAHARDITLNALIVEVLEEEIARVIKEKSS